MNAKRLILTILLVIFPTGISGASIQFAGDGPAWTGSELQIVVFPPGDLGRRHGATSADNPAIDIDQPKPPKPPKPPEPLKPPEAPKPPEPPKPPRA